MEGCENMKKHLVFVLSCVTNFLLSIFSYFYLYIAITDINGTVKGSAYEIQEPEKSTYTFIGMTMLIVYILVGFIIQYLLYRLSKQSMKRYVVCMSIIFATGLIIGYFCSLRL